jgi:mannose-6-phosphate isomerase-like protein (cupin superfamily)
LNTDGPDMTPAARDCAASSADMAHLEALTDKLPAPLTALCHERGGHGVSYEVESGSCFGFGVFKDALVAIQRAFLAPNTHFPVHVHEHSREVLGVVTGSGRVTQNGVTVELRATDVLISEPGVPHDFETDEGCWVWVVTMPADEGYPR